MQQGESFQFPPGRCGREEEEGGVWGPGWRHLEEPVDAVQQRFRADGFGRRGCLPLSCPPYISELFLSLILAHDLPVPIIGLLFTRC